MAFVCCEVVLTFKIVPCSFQTESIVPYFCLEDEILRGRTRQNP